MAGWRARRWMAWAAVLAMAAAVGAGWLGQAGDAGAGAPRAKKVLQMAMRTDGPKSLDPAAGSTQYDNIACSLMYETLVTFKYNDPKALEPLLLAEMPTFSADGKTVSFKLKPGVRFHDDACFPGGKGRVVTPDDVFYSIKRIADKRNGLKNWWLLDGVIEGLDAFKDAQNASLDAGKGFDYDAPVAGFKKISETEFTIRLNKPVYRFLYTLAQFQLSVVPREAVEKYGKDFGFKPVGTGPFVLDKWEPKQSLAVNRNPNYHPVLYPAREAWSREDRRRRMDRAAGQAVPPVDRMEFTMFVQDQPMWLEFVSGRLAMVDVGVESLERAIDLRSFTLLADWEAKGVTWHTEPVMDCVHVGFNMEDPVVGGLAPERRALRQAIHLAVDLREINEVAHHGTAVVYDGPIPPGVDGHAEGGKAPFSLTTPDLERAKRLLAEAGWPNGRNAQGEQLRLTLWTANNGAQMRANDLYQRQIERLGVEVQVRAMDFSTMVEAVDNRAAQMFAMSWISDYADAERGLRTFYGPNRTPGVNGFNYARPEFDRLFERAEMMEAGPERTRLYEQMRDMVIADAVFVGSLAQRRVWLMAPWMLNCRPTERTWSWLKYLDVEAGGGGR